MLGNRIWTIAAIAVAIFIGYKLVVAHADRHRSLRRADDVVSFVSTTLPRRRRWRPTFPAFLRLTFWSGVIAGILLLSGLVGLSGTTTAGTSATATFTATEDTFLKDSRADRVYGQYVTLQADNYPSVKRILVRFRVSGIPRGASVISATLRMFVVDPSGETGEVHAVGGGWSEAATTWSSAPAVGVKIADITDPAQVGTWREADVTAAVTGNGDVDFYIVTPHNDGVEAREQRDQHKEDPRPLAGEGTGNRTADCASRSVYHGVLALKQHFHPPVFRVLWSRPSGRTVNPLTASARQGRYSAGSPGISMTGRISTVPRRAPGCRAAMLIASSRSLTSTK